MIQKSPAFTRFALSSHSLTQQLRIFPCYQMRVPLQRGAFKIMIIINARGMIKERILCGEIATPSLEAKKSGTVISSQRNAMDGFLL